MRFGRLALAEAEGAILAHAVKAGGLNLKKGKTLARADIEGLRAAGLGTIVGAQLEPGDVGEDVAARRLAERVAGAHVRLEEPFTGRCNLIAPVAGLVRIDAAAVDAINAVHEAITVATLPPFQPVVKGEMIATVKIIPFAVPEANLARALAASPAGAVAIAPFQPKRIAVISTLLPGLKPNVVEKTVRLLERRLTPTGAALSADLRVKHEAAALGEAIHGAVSEDVIVIFGASAITDRRDVIPTAIESVGGSVEHLGMPVDPGNLLLLGRLHVAGRDVPIVGAPGCARSPKTNGFDFVLWRLLAGLDVSSADLRKMGVGGLLSEIESRPQKRRGLDAEPAAEHESRRVAGASHGGSALHDG